MFRCWSKGLSFCLLGKMIARFHTRRVLPPRAPLLLYGLEALRLWVLLPKNSRIPYEAGLAPSRSPAIVPTCAMPKTPHPPNQVRHHLLEEMALLPCPSYLHNSSLHKLRYVMAKQTPYPPLHTGPCHLLPKGQALLPRPNSLHNSVDIIKVHHTAARSPP